MSLWHEFVSHCSGSHRSCRGPKSMMQPVSLPCAYRLSTGLVGDEEPRHVEGLEHELRRCLTVDLQRQSSTFMTHECNSATTWPTHFSAPSEMQSYSAKHMQANKRYMSHASLLRALDLDL